ncbi:MAG TPA: ATP-binding cassette domain-containing protein [Conexibacter sp.]
MLVRFDNVTKRYLRGPREIVALDQVSFDVEPGERFGVLGTARGGKSTLLRLAAGLERPDEGTVRLDDRDIATLSRREHARLLRHEIGCIWEASARSDAEALQYVAWPLLSAGARYRDAIGQARAILRDVDSSDCAGARLCELAASELTRISIAQALIRHPRLLLADEPSKSLDAVERGAVLDLLRSVAIARGVTLIVTAGDASGLVAPSRLASLDRGRLLLRSRQTGEVVPFKRPQRTG